MVGKVAGLWPRRWVMVIPSQIMNILKINVRFQTILKTMFTVQENVNVVLLEMTTLTHYAGIGFRILLIKYLYLIFLYVLFKSQHIEIISSTINVNKSNITTNNKQNITCNYFLFYLQLTQNISSNSQTLSYKGHLYIVVILSISPR